MTGVVPPDDDIAPVPPTEVTVPVGIACVESNPVLLAVTIRAPEPARLDNVVAPVTPSVPANVELLPK